MTQHLVCVTAGQRSGTNAFRKALSDTGRFTDQQEVFNTATLDWPANYFGYCRERAIGFADILSGVDAENLCRDYLELLCRLAGDTHPLFDVKFNSWNEIRSPWTFMHQEPYLLKHLKRRGAKMIFIWRRDFVGQVISDRIAARLRKWHNLKPEHVEAPFALDVEENRNLALLMCQSEYYFWNNLKEYPDSLILCYEELFNGTGLSTQTRARVCDLIGEDLKFRDAGYFQKNQIEKDHVVTNYADVAGAVAEVAAVWRRDFLTQVDGR